MVMAKPGRVGFSGVEAQIEEEKGGLWKPDTCRALTQLCHATELTHPGLFKVESHGHFGIKKAPTGSHEELCQVAATSFA